MLGENSLDFTSVNMKVKVVVDVTFNPGMWESALLNSTELINYTALNQVYSVRLYPR